jgi:hypothetical protein
LLMRLKPLLKLTEKSLKKAEIWNGDWFVIQKRRDHYH